MTLVRFDRLPPGVSPIRDYRSLGATLVECDHATAHQIASGGWIAYGPGGEEWRGVARGAAPHGWTLDYRGRLFCSVCKGDEHTTDCFRRPVKMLALVPAGATQASLF